MGLIFNTFYRDDTVVEKSVWHNLRVTYHSHNNFVALEVDNKLVDFAVYQSEFSGLRLSNGSLYIGKVSSAVSKLPYGLIARGFEGCIDQVCAI